MQAKVAAYLKRTYTATTANEVEQRLGECADNWDDAKHFGTHST